MRTKSLWGWLTTIAVIAVGMASPASASPELLPGGGRTAVVTSQSQYHIYNRNSLDHGVSSCLAVPGASTAVVGLNQFAPCRYIDQWWWFDFKFDTGGVDYYSIRNVNSNLCVSVPAASTQPAVQVNQFPCGGFPDQIWGTVGLGGGNFALRRYNTNLCLSVPGASTSPGEIVNQFPCGFYPDQVWFVSTINT